MESEQKIENKQTEDVFLAARMKPEQKQKVMSMAKKAGMSLGAFLLALVDQYDGVEVNFIPKPQPRAARGRAVLN